LDEILFRLITTFDEVPPKLPRACPPRRVCIAAAFTAFAKFYGVDLKRVPPKSRPAARRRGRHLLT